VSVSARVSGHSLIVSFRAATLELPKHRGPLHLEYGAASLCGGRIGNVSESRLVKIRPVTRSRRVTGSAPAVDLTVPIGGCKRTAPLGAFVRVAIEQSGQHLPLAAVTGSIPTLVR
jgi:hypothetical protein